MLQHAAGHHSPSPLTLLYTPIPRVIPVGKTNQIRSRLKNILVQRYQPTLSPLTYSISKMPFKVNVNIVNCQIQSP